MSGNQPTQTVISFGLFEADLQTQELRKQGIRLRLPGQSFQILKMLLERPGELVTRDELQQALWPSDTHVDFERGVNAAVNRLRDVLGDSADSPKLIETLPRRGYRFIGKIDMPLRPVDVPNYRRAWVNVAIWTVGGAACVLAVALVFVRFRHVTNVEEKFTPVPFTSYPGSEDCPTFSPDGSQIAFAWNGDPKSGAEGFDLYVKVIGSENLLRLTRHPSERICAAWSPDGTQIAFHRVSGADTGVYVVPALGGPERKLRSIRIPFGSTSPISWSPDGKWIAFVDFLPPYDNFRIHLLSLETLESKQIPHVAECINEWYPAFSHSGEQLVYFCLLKTSPNEIGIYSVPSSGGPPRLVTRFTTGYGWPQGIAWTANDRKLVLSRPRTGNINDFELDEIALADGTLRKLPFGREAFTPSISAIGDRLAYAVSSSPNADIWRKDLLHPEAPAVKLISSTYDQASPQYSPDGKHIAFASSRGGPWEMWMSDADGTRLVRMSDAKSSAGGSPSWSPDSKKFAFDSWQSGHPEVYIVDIAERMPRKMVTNLSDIFVPSWSHDGRWLYVQSGTAQALKDRIFRCQANGGDAVALSAEFRSVPLESYDGETLYFMNLDNGAIEMVPLKPIGAQSVLGGMPAVSNPHLWTVVPGGIYFVPADAPKSVRYFDFATKQVRQILEIKKELEFSSGLSVSPDGRWILYSQEDEASTDIMLVENFR